jgi:two-component system, NtrC family, nitrogen regulation sensor histidine kinase GlnL
MAAEMTERLSLEHRVLEGMTFAVLLFDARLRLQYINPAGEDLFSISARHLIGQPYTSLIEEDEDLSGQLLEALQNRHPFTRHEVAMRLGSCDSMMMDITGVPLLEPGQMNEILVELHPINRLLRISREENLQVQQRATQDVLRGLAHEVKNPLGGLRGAAQLLEKQLDSEELKEYTQVIINEADRLQNLVDRILGPNQAPQKTTVNIHNILEHVRSLMQAEEKAAVQYERDYDPSIPELIVDPDQLVQAILNIVRNARQAVSDDNGLIVMRTRVERKYTIGSQRNELVVRVEIIDNGQGIPEQKRESIFFPMVTGRADGTGLGLSIAQNIVHQHDGTIELESDPGRTVFSILLPIQTAGSEKP